MKPSILTSKSLEDRRLFLKFLAGSPLLYLGLTVCTSEKEGGLVSSSVLPKSTARGPGIITSPDQALNVFDLEAVAREKLPPAHYGYIATGVDDDLTLHENHEAYTRIKIRMRRLIDVRQVNASTELFGEKWPTPIVISPCGSQRAFHPEGEAAVARAARSKNHLQILSTVTTTSVEDVVEARGAPVWYQLYPTDRWEDSEQMLSRAEAVGCPVVVLTVDLTGGSNRETMNRMRMLDDRDCSTCHSPGMAGYTKNKPMINSIGEDFNFASLLDWEFVRKLKKSTKMKVVIKGIVTSEDAKLCLDNGVDGIIVSNHGGRAAESMRATIDCLPEIVEVVKGQVPVLIDGGIRRGTDIFKALAFGADAICIGRPYLWGLAAFGQPGVETVLSLLTAELQMVMRQAGVTSLGQISKRHIA